MNQTTISRDTVSNKGGKKGTNVIGIVESSRRYSKSSRILRFVGITGVTISSIMMIWFLAGLIGVIPSMIEIFGVPGLRFPAGIAISGLLAASIGFNEF